ncbi:MAG: glutamate decarboxylase [Clostridia bacterium]|nr:glutamate decarboxylase [Clostridia bacterium]
MWTVVCTSQDRQMSENLCDALRSKNILVKIIGAASESKFDILVPHTEVEQAHGVLIDMTF